eukprot:199521-Lingulodinium_polyedra.AAC.1
MARAWRARGVQCANRCNGRRSIRPHNCVAFSKRCTMARSNQPRATTTARTSRAPHTPRKQHLGRGVRM